MMNIIKGTVINYFSNQWTVKSYIRPYGYIETQAYKTAHLAKVAFVKLCDKLGKIIADGEYDVKFVE
jgi:hypothetical protein